MRSNEFKLRQKESRSGLICLSASQRAEVKGLMKSGFSKKSIALVYGLNYSDLKAIKQT